jgi:hypothetical protein
LFILVERFACPVQETSAATPWQLEKRFHRREMEASRDDVGQNRTQNPSPRIFPCLHSFASPVSVAQTRALPSEVQLTNAWLSGLNETPSTAPGWRSLVTKRPVAESQTKMA